jgi:hypothetical protein
MIERRRTCPGDFTMEPIETGSPDQIRVALTKLENDYRIARLGLQGTLWGAWASLAALVAIVGVQVWAEHYIVQGWAFTAMVAAIVIPVTAYGAFIFHEALSISVNVRRDGSFDISANVANRPKP